MILRLLSGSEVVNFHNVKKGNHANTSEKQRIAEYDCDAWTTVTLTLQAREGHQ